VTIAGQRVSEIVDASFDAGVHSLSINARGLSSGSYLVVVRGEDRVLTEKVILLK
jgi:hypothetical protein